MSDHKRGRESKYRHVAEFAYSTPWAILPEKLEAIAELLELRMSGARLTPDEIEARLGAAPPARPAPRTGAVAVIPLYGTIIPRADMFSEMSGATSAEAFGASVQAAAADPAVGAILIDVDSPGGAVSLIPETAQIVADAALQKPVVAIANTLMASAAYWLASQASEVVITPSGMAGSIGVLAMHADNSARLEQMGVDVSLIHAGQFKAEGNPFQPLTDEARADIQAKVDEFYGMFVDGVAQGRGVAASMVRDGFGQGRVVTAAEAVKAGMADRVATFDQTVEELLVRASADAGPGAHQGGAPPGAATITETDPEAATSGLSFVREAIAVRDTATSLARRASSLAEVKRGRLTAAKRDALEDACDGLAAATTAITGLLAETDPARDAGRAALLDAEFAEMERTLIETGARP